MSDRSWPILPPGLTADELTAWAPRIPTPVALTGATGFVGSHLLEALVAAGIRPRVLARNPARLSSVAREGADVVWGDLSEPCSLRNLVKGCGTVLHLAGLVRAPDAASFDCSNRVGTENVLTAIEEMTGGARFVYVSSLAAAGPSTSPAGRGSGEPPRPISAYGRSKLQGEDTVRRRRGEWVILRPPVIYGPRDIGTLRFFRLAARGYCPIPRGERWVTVAYVADVVRAILAAAAGAGLGLVLHLGEPRPYRMKELISLVAEAGDVQTRPVRIPLAILWMAGWGGNVLQRLGCSSVALTSDKSRELCARHWSSRTTDSLAILGLAGSVPFRIGARVTWAWYRDHGWVSCAKLSRA